MSNQKINKNNYKICIFWMRKLVVKMTMVHLNNIKFNLIDITEKNTNNIISKIKTISRYFKKN